MIKCDICGEVVRDGMQVPQPWRTEGIVDLCTNCNKELVDCIQEFSKPLQNQINQHARMFLIGKKEAEDAILK